MRRLFHILVGISFALAVLIAAMWVRSFVASDHFFWQFWKEQPTWTFWTQDEVLIGHGAIGFNRIIQARQTYANGVTWRERVKIQHGVFPFHQTTKPEFPDFHFTSNDNPVYGFKLGHFINGTAGVNNYSEGWEIVLPFWFLFPLTAVLPAVWFVLWRRKRRRVAEGHCLFCGYDMRATPDRCPECGNAPTVSPTSA